MIKLFNILAYKSNIRGYWQQGNKLYRDNIDIININHKDIETYNVYKKILFNQKKQLAIFYINTTLKIGHIVDKNDKVTVLNKSKRIIRKHIKPSFFKALLNKYNGFTVYKKKGYYLFEVFYNE